LSEIIQSVSNIIVFSDVTVSNPNSIFNDFALTGTATGTTTRLINTLNLIGNIQSPKVTSASSTILFSQDLHNHTIEVAVGDILELNGDVTSNRETRYPEHEVVFNGTVIEQLLHAYAQSDLIFDSAVEVYINHLYSTIAFGQSVSSHIFNQKITQIFDLDDIARIAHVHSASNSITFAQEMYRDFTTDSNIVFGQSAGIEKVRSGSSTLVLTQTVVVNSIRSLSLSSTIQFIPFGLGWLSKGGNLYSLNLSGFDLSYDPYTGQEYSDALNEPQPSLSGNMGVRLSYGGSSITFQSCGYETIQSNMNLRSPDFGNRKSKDVRRALNRLRNGHYMPFRLVNSPVKVILELSISGISEETRIEYYDFLITSLGQEVTLDDHNQHQWLGIIANPDEAIVERGNGQYAVNVQFIGEITS
jgi:hypothetical protein